MLQLPADVDWSRLSEPAQRTLREIAVPIAEQGVSYEALAEKLGLSRRSIRRMLDELQLELTAVSGGDLLSLFALSDDEYQALKADIAEHGQLVPIVKDEKDEVIDGHHRLRACEELGIKPRFSPVAGLDIKEKRSLGFALNLCRRQMSSVQRREIVRAELVRDPTASNLAVARRAGVSDKTVGAIRDAIQTRDSEFPSLSKPTVYVISIPGVTREERDAWMAAASDSELSLSEWLRELANREVVLS